MGGMVVSKLVGVTERAAPAPGRAWDLINACVGEQLPSELTFDSHARFLLPPSVSGCEVARHPMPDPPVGHENPVCLSARACTGMLPSRLESLVVLRARAQELQKRWGGAYGSWTSRPAVSNTSCGCVGQFACKRKSTTRILRDVPGVEERNFEEVPSCRGSSQWTKGCVDKRSGFGEEDDSNTGGVGERELVLVFSVL